jgi:hypothetical protein
VSLEDELEPKLTEIDESARSQYASVYLDNRGFVVKPGTNQLDFNEIVKGNADPIWEVGMVVPDPTEEDLHREQEAYNGFLQSLADLKTRFRTFYALGEHTDFALMTTRLGANSVSTFPTGPGALTSPSTSITLEAPTVLESVLYSYTEHMHNVDAMIDKEHWGGGEGSAAWTFHTEFLEPYLRSVFWQSGYVRELAIAVQSYHDAIKKGREDILAIADLCKAQMYPNNEGSPRTLGIASLITSAAALYPPFSIPAGIYSFSSGLISFLDSESASERNESPYEVTITGGPGDIPEVLWSTWNAIGQLEQWLSNKDRQLARGLEQDLNNTGAFASPYLRLPRPEVSDRAGQPAPLGQLDFIDRPGGGRNAVVVELRELYQAGYVNLPNAAYCYNDAAGGLSGLAIPAPLSQFFPQSIPKFNQSRDRLHEIFFDTGDALSDAGVALVNTAKTYQLTDEERAQLLGQIEQINMLYPPPIPVGR